MYSFYGNRKVHFTLSLLLLLGGLLFTLFYGVKLDIQFKGGSLVSYSYKGDLDVNQADGVVSEALGIRVTAQKTASITDDTTMLVINVAGNEALTSQQMTAMVEALRASWPDADIELSSSQLVAPFIGREMLLNGVLAMLVASVLIIAYVWFSFRSVSGPSAGVMALIALFHDIVIAFYVFVLMGAPVNETVIAVVLSILGFSINDTIVIYDRIRENIRLTKGSMPLADLVDLSINQSLTRTINTSVCTFGAVFVAYILSTVYHLDSIREFALPMLVGIVSGTYSSIVLAGPLWVAWKTRGGRTGYES